jgi:ribosomal protein S3
LIGRKGENVKKVRQRLEALVGKKIDLEIKETEISQIWMPIWWRSISQTS